VKTAANSFHDNPIIYHLMTDRFSEICEFAEAWGDNKDNIGTFHGGNFAGITKKLNEGWFSQLGVNALLITAPYEQIHGWVPGANGEFKHWAYHGYWVLDYTVPDPHFGSADDLTELVNTAHGLGIKIIIDVVISHAGYPDLRTMSEYLPDTLQPGWEDATTNEYERYFNTDHKDFDNWWGRDWVRASLPNYLPGIDQDLTVMEHGMPKFRTESPNPVSLPAFLKAKSGSQAVDLSDTSVRGYLINWLTYWVRNFGIDGFRCDSAKHVDLATWHELKLAGEVALAEWRNSQIGAPQSDEAFWMTGEVFGNGIERSDYFDHGFDNLINFQFQAEIKTIFQTSNSEHPYERSLSMFRLDKLYSRYAAQLARSANYNILSYISSHDTELFDRAYLTEGCTALMLAPGGVQIFYGDETSRTSGSFTPADPAQATRSDMNWHTVDHEILRHWKILGMFRSRHVSIARGVHQKLCDEPYIFSRHDPYTGDSVLLAINAYGELDIEVGSLFSDGQLLHDAYSGRNTIVIDGHVHLFVDRFLLIERV
jgi:alpha-amylase